MLRLKLQAINRYFENTYNLFFQRMYILTIHLFFYFLRKYTFFIILMMVFYFTF